MNITMHLPPCKLTGLTADLEQTSTGPVDQVTVHTPSGPVLLVFRCLEDYDEWIGFFAGRRADFGEALARYEARPLVPLPERVHDVWDATFGCPIEAVAGGERFPCTFRRDHNPPHSWESEPLPDLPQREPGRALAGIESADVLLPGPGSLTGTKDPRGSLESGQEHPGAGAAMPATLSCPGLIGGHDFDDEGDCRACGADIFAVATQKAAWERDVPGGCPCDYIWTGIVWTRSGSTPACDIHGGHAPLLDPDCAAGKHGSCAGGPCQCACHEPAYAVPSDLPLPGDHEAPISGTAQTGQGHPDAADRAQHDAETLLARWGAEPGEITALREPAEPGEG